MIELNGIQISDNNINTKKNVKIYVDEKQLDSKVGKLSDLKTTDKSSIVNAINEVKDTTDTLQVDVNRIYSDFTIIPNTPTEQEFTYKKSDEGVIEKGVAVIDKMKGNSVVWNQLIKDFREPSNWLMNGNDVTVVKDKIHIKFASASSSNAFGVKSSAFFAGHRYCVLMNNENAVPLTAIKFGSASGVGASGSTLNFNPPAITIAIPKSSYGDGALWFWPSDETKLEGDFSNIFAIDLTQMFGAGNEPSTYEEFLSRKPKVADEYAYNEGTIVSNKVEKVKTTGINLWDEQWELGTIAWTGVEIVSNTRIRSGFVPIFANTTYYFKCGSVRYEVFFYDANKSHISHLPLSLANGTLTTPNGAVYLRFTTNSSYTETTYAHNICINLSNPAFNGQYAPYEKHELDLSWVKDIKDNEGVKLFEDGMRSAGTAFDEVRKNKAIKRIGIVDLGSLSWNRDMLPNGNWAFYNTNALPSMKYDGSANMVSTKYQTKKLEQAAAGTYEIDQIVFNKTNKQLFIVDKSIEQATDFKAAMQGVLLYYELTEPIEVEYDEKNLTYPVVVGGTEEAIVSEPSTPMRASITYGSNTVATILSLMNRVNELERKIIN